MIVMGKGKNTRVDRERIRFLNASAENILAARSGNNWSVGKAVIGSFTHESDLVEELKNQIDAVRKRAG